MKKPDNPAASSAEDWLNLAGGRKAVQRVAVITLAGALLFVLMIPDPSGLGDFRLIGASVLIPVSLGALLQLWRGRNVAAYFFILWGSFFAITFSALIAAGLRTALVFAYPAVIMGAMALGPQMVLRVGAAAIAAVVGIGLAGHFSLLPEPRLPSLFIMGLIYVLVLAITTVVASAMVREQKRWRDKEGKATLALEEGLRELAAREQDLRLVMNNVPALICAFDGMTCRFASPRYAEFFGLSADAIVGRHLRDILGEESFAHAAPLVERTHSGETITYMARRTSPVFGERILHISLVPGITANGGTPGFYGLMLDVTEQEQARTEIERLNRELDRRVKERTADLTAANRELESFAYSISHDLRAPLRGIDGFSLMAIEEYGGKLGEQGRGYLERVRAAAQRMGTLIDDILELSRVSRQAMRKERVDLSRQAEELLEAMREADPQRRVETSVAADCTAEGDPRLLHVLLQNLLENAWKYTSRQDDARIAFGAESLDTGETAFFVRDNGVGFDMKYADRLFSPFQRLHSPDDYPGSGIGLATVARIVHRHGGRVWAESTPEQGTTLRFTLATRGPA